MLNAGYCIFVLSGAHYVAGEANVARFSPLTTVGTSAGHQLASLAEWPTKVDELANGTYRLGI